ncbi:MAG: MBL fold metallo-hydrolase [Balneola sp.]|jgi:hydroxyacylglutathione hydrolase|nr:MBL fold metallo-hydrolase [Balneola sp.]MBE78545.1 MBL fold metallo-hydrolase [Balneola sp.]HBX65008.1 MBL fold metallo-hydrolase [Balneolaceae bacterium]|tara:strand:- start:2120 stop:3553 length:1434 start_codon:yes stop_codon:yes gene_type:complete
MFFQQIFEDKLAQYAYLIGCQANGKAIVIDPMRDIERYKELALDNNLELVAAAETHIHADYLSGLRELAEQGMKVYASDEGDKDWKYEWLKGSDYNYELLKDGDEFSIGNIKFTTVHSPGHTPEHVSFMVTDGAATDEPMGILSGDFVFVGDVGRPDLLESAAGQEGAMESSARVLYDSLKKFKEMPEYLQLWPGHGAGSACGKALGAVPESTVGYEQRFNGSIKAAISEQEFVDYILEGQPEPPLYFARMKRDNKLGPAVLGDLPQPEHTTIEKMIGEVRLSEAVIVDTRNRTDFMNGHIQGSLLSPMNKQFNTIVGSYVTENEGIYLIIPEEKVEEAVIDLIRIGLDNIKGWATPEELNKFREKGGELFKTDTIDFGKVEEYLASEEMNLLDVRKKSEFDEGHHPEAVNIAHTRLLDQLDDVPSGKPIMVHCKSGARAAVASAMLERADFSVTYVDDEVEPWLEKNDWDKKGLEA